MAPLDMSDWRTPFPYLAKRALAEDFEQFKLRWISFLTALFHMVGDRNLLIRSFILHKQHPHETAIQDRRHVSRHTHVPRLQTHLYLHSVRKTLPPPWVHPWSDAHLPAAKPTSFIREVRSSTQFHNACSSMLSAEQDTDRGWCKPTCVTINSSAITVCLHCSKYSGICCQTV